MSRLLGVFLLFGTATDYSLLRLFSMGCIGAPRLNPGMIIRLTLPSFRLSKHGTQSSKRRESRIDMRLRAFVDRVRGRGTDTRTILRTQGKDRHLKQNCFSDKVVEHDSLTIKGVNIGFVRSKLVLGQVLRLRGSLAFALATAKGGTRYGDHHGPFAGGLFAR
jgi:hypothetical protein